jgi:Ca2+/H+ antiporter
LKLRVEVLEQDNQRLSEAKELHPQSQEAARLSNDSSALITVVGLPGGSRVAGGLSARGWRMLRFEIGLTISCLVLAIIAIRVNLLFHNSCDLRFPNVIGLMRSQS